MRQRCIYSASRALRPIRPKVDNGGHGQSSVKRRPQCAEGVSVMYPLCLQFVSSARQLEAGCAQGVFRARRGPRLYRMYTQSVDWL
jgi:hypothetical protein